MNDKRKTKKQLLEDLQLERERSLALQEVSKRVAAAHDTDEVLDLIVNEAAKLLGVDACFIRLLEGDHLTASVATEAAVEYLAEASTKYNCRGRHVLYGACAGHQETEDRRGSAG